jgi:hypothetical protein
MLVLLQEVAGYFDFLTWPPCAIMYIPVYEGSCLHAISGRSNGIMSVTGVPLKNFVNHRNFFKTSMHLGFEYPNQYRKLPLLLRMTTVFKVR